MPKQKKFLTPAEELAAIRQKLGMYTVEPKVSRWLNTGAPRLNAVLGSRELGVAYGRMIELFGFESHGKTLINLFLAGLAQRDGALVGWMDLENSWDDKWVMSRGLDPDGVYLFRTKMIAHKKTGKALRIQSAEELCAEAQEWFKAHSDVHKYLGVDSVKGFNTAEEIDTGVVDRNMRTKVALAQFLTVQIKAWVPYALNYNILMVFINQLYEAIGVHFGNRDITPGGRALKYYCSVRAKVQRVKGGRLLQSGRIVGLRGVITNVKNKVGEGSIEGARCGYKLTFNENRWKFMSPEAAKDEVGEASTESEE